VAAQEQLARPASRVLGARFTLGITLISFLTTAFTAQVRADATTPAPAATPEGIIDAAHARLPASPALDLRSSTAEEPKTSIFRRWWFWTAIGAAVATTAVVIVVSARGQAPPATNLGNQKF